MNAMQTSMTVDRLMARLVELEQENTRLHQEYLHLGAELRDRLQAPEGDQALTIAQAPNAVSPPGQHTATRTSAATGSMSRQEHHS